MMSAALELRLIAWLVTYLGHSSLLLGGAWAAEWVTERVGGRALRWVSRLAETLWRAALLGPVVSASVQTLAEPEAFQRIMAWVVPHAPLMGASAAGGSMVPDVVGRVTQLLGAWFAAGGTTVALGTFAAIAAVRLGRLIVGTHRLRRLLSHRVTVTSPALLRRLRMLTRQTSSRLTVADGVASPLVLPGAEVCLPAWVLRELSDDELQAVLAHEAAHVRRHDVAWCWLVRLTHAVFFLQPLNRVAVARLHALAEQACDDWALAHRATPQGLAGALARVGARLAGSGTPTSAAEVRALGALAMATSEGLALQRVRRILHPLREPLVPPPLAARGLTVLAVLGGALAVAPSVSVAHLLRAAGVRYEILAHDAAGAFSLMVERRDNDTPRVVTITVDGRRVPSSRVRQRGGDVRLLAEHGTPALQLTLDPGGGMRWQSRPAPGRTPSTGH